MPTYDYRCKSCDHRWELFQSITAKAIRKCPECGRLKAQRIIGPGAGIIFRGSGFYQTDYRSDAYKKAAEADRKSQPSAEGNGKKDKSDSGGKSESTSKASASKD